MTNMQSKGSNSMDWSPAELLGAADLAVGVGVAAVVWAGAALAARVAGHHTSSTKCQAATEVTVNQQPKSRPETVTHLPKPQRQA